MTCSTLTFCLSLKLWSHSSDTASEPSCGKRIDKRGRRGKIDKRRRRGRIDKRGRRGKIDKRRGGEGSIREGEVKMGESVR